MSTENQYLNRGCRTIQSNSASWAAAVAGAANVLLGNYCYDGRYYTRVGAQETASYFIWRGFLYVPAFLLPAGATVESAKLYLWVVSHADTEAALHVTRGVHGDPIDVGEWTAQTSQVTSGGSIDYSDLTDDAYNAIELNSEAISWLDQDGAIEGVHEGYNSGENTDLITYGSIRLFQTFKVGVTDPHTVTKVKLKMWRKGDAGTITVNIKAAGEDHKPDGPVLATGTLAATDLGTITPGAWHEVTFGSGFALTANTLYGVEVSVSAGDDTNNWIKVRCDSSGSYSAGKFSASTDGGENWTNYDNYDMYFIEYAADISASGTLLCLKDIHDLNAAQPAHLYDGHVFFYTAQKGPVYLPYLEVVYHAAVFPSDAISRVSSIRHICRPGSCRMLVGLGDLGFDIDVAEVTVRRALDTAKEAEPTPEPVEPKPVRPEPSKLPYVPDAGVGVGVLPETPGMGFAPSPTYIPGVGYGIGVYPLPKEGDALAPLSSEVESSLASRLWRAITPWKEEEGETFGSEVAERWQSFTGWIGGLFK